MQETVLLASLQQMFASPFMQKALLASLFASIACGVVGTLVVHNRLTFLAGGVSHAAYGGIGLSIHYNWPLLPCTIGFSLLVSLVMGGITLYRRNDDRDNASDVTVGVLWAAGMAFGIILVDLTPGYKGELIGFLFGSILTVPASDLVAMAVFDGILVFLLLFFHQGLWAATLDREFAKARGLPTNFLTLLLIGLTAVSVVMLIRIVGLILVLALLVIPPHLARIKCRSLYTTMIAAGAYSLAFCLLGLILSWQTDISSGASIIAIASATYFLAHVLRVAKSARHIPASSLHSSQ